LVKRNLKHRKEDIMTANLEQRVETLENKNDYLGNVLGQFISSVNGVILRMEASVAEFREEISTFKEEVRADTKALKKEMAEFKEEIRADTKAFKEESRADTKSLKKEMKGLRKETGMLTRKMGTLVEDMVAPNMRLIAREYFGDTDDFSFFGVRIFKRNDRREGREFDVVAVSDRNFIINETKSKPKPEHIGEFIEVLEDIRSYFPECEGRRIIPVFSSLYLPENIRTYLTRNRIYAMGMKEGTMDILNFEQIEN
jgi:hypothetical protein